MAITLRLDEELHARLHRIAQHQERTLTGQIVWLLRAGVEQFEAEHQDLDELPPRRGSKNGQ